MTPAPSQLLGTSAPGRPCEFPPPAASSWVPKAQLKLECYLQFALGAADVDTWHAQEAVKRSSIAQGAPRGGESMAKLRHLVVGQLAYHPALELVSSLLVL